MTVKKLIKALRWRLRLLIRGSVQKAVSGLPDGIDFDTLADLCTRHLDERLVNTLYVHLSGWKAEGAYRLILETAKGRSWPLVYKDALYDLKQIPALKKLPVLPGPPEYAIARSGNGPLAKYLPVGYMCTEVSPQRHYRYIFEDLSREYQTPRTVDDILRIATELSEFHDVLAECSISLEPNCLLHYGLEFSRLIQNYAYTNLEKYFVKNTNDVITSLIRHWHNIMELCASAEFFPPNYSRPIHGDFNLSNIWLHRSIPDRMKIVDWEWAGRGVPHADLVSLLNEQSKELVQKALTIYADRNPAISYEEHKRFFHWCRLERGLFSASFFSVQVMESSARTQFNIPRHIERSLVAVMQAYQELTH